MEENSIAINVHSKGFLERVSSTILFLITFLIPFFFLPVSFISPQFSTSLLFAFGVILATLFVIVSVFGKGSFSFPKSIKYILGIYVIVPVVYVLAGIANGFSRMSFLGYTFDITTVGFIFLAFVYMFLVSILSTDKKKIFYSYLAFVLSSFLVSLFLIIRMIGGVGVLSFGMFTNLTSTMIGNWNNVGVFFGIGAVLSLVTYQMLSLSKLTKVILICALALSIFFLALINFNIVWIIIALVSLLFVLYGIFNREKETIFSSSWKEKLSFVPFYPLIVFIISVIFVIWGSVLGGYLSNYFKIVNVDVRPSLSVTVDIARNTLKNQPLFGSGPNSFVAQWLSYKPSDIINTIFWNTDFSYGIGLLPTFAVTTGLVGMASWIIFFCLYIFLGLKSIFAKVEDAFVKYLVVSSFFVSFYLWVMAWVYVPSTVVFVLTFFFTGLFFASIYIAKIVDVHQLRFSHTPKSGFISSFILVLVFVGVLALGFGLFKNSESLWYFQKSSYALNTLKDTALSEKFMKQAVSTVPYDVYYRALSEIEILKLQAILSQDVNKVSKEEIQKQYSTTLSDAITAGQNARDADPVNYLNWVALGSVYESAVSMNVQNAYESALFAYSEALRRNPKNPSIYLYFARLSVAKQDLKQARQYALNAISAKQNYLDAYYLLSQIEVADKNLKGAIDSVTAASIINPNDPSIFFQLGLLKYNNQDFVGAVESLENSLKLSPDYANAKYFLGLSYEITKERNKAIILFEDLAKTNPDNAEVKTILESLKAGKSLFTEQEKKPETKSKLPVQEQQ